MVPCICICWCRSSVARRCDGIGRWWLLKYRWGVCCCLCVHIVMTHFWRDDWHCWVSMQVGIEQVGTWATSIQVQHLEQQKMFQWDADLCYISLNRMASYFVGCLTLWTSNLASMSPAVKGCECLLIAMSPFQWRNRTIRFIARPRSVVLCALIRPVICSKKEPCMQK